MVVNWGTGRKDYSKNVEESTVPITRSHQYRVAGPVDYDLTPYAYMTIDEKDTYGSELGFYWIPSDDVDYSLNNFEVEFHSNVLIWGKLVLYNINTGAEVVKQIKYGYKKVSFLFPEGFLITEAQTAAGWRGTLMFLPGGYHVRALSTGLKDRLVRV